MRVGGPRSLRLARSGIVVRGAYRPKGRLSAVEKSTFSSYKAGIATKFAISPALIPIPASDPGP